MMISYDPDDQVDSGVNCNSSSERDCIYIATTVAIGQRTPELIPLYEEVVAAVFYSGCERERCKEWLLKSHLRHPLCR